MNSIKQPIIITGIITLTACQSTPLPKPTTPTPIMVDNTAHCLTIDDPICHHDWWTVFGDEVLDDYMKKIVKHNQELSVATLTLQKSLLNKQKSQERFLINSQAGANRQTQKSLSTGETTHSRGFDVNLGASWEVDLWGKLQLQQNLTEWETHAVQADRQALFLSLSANAVREYINLIGINQKLMNAQKAQAFQQKQQQYLNKQVDLGLIARADLVAIEQTLNNLKQTALILEHQKNDSLANLSSFAHVDMDKLPTTLKNQHQIPKIPHDFYHINANAILNRPDLQALLWRLAISLEQKNLLQKNQYPTLMFSAGATAQSPNLLDLLKVPVLNWGVSLNIPQINYKEYQHNINIAQIDEYIATLNYQDTTHKALNDVQQKLNAWQNGKDNHDVLLTAQKLAKEQLTHQQKRLELGLISTKEWTEHQETYRQSQTALTDNAINQVLNWIAVYQAVGGLPNESR